MINKIIELLRSDPILAWIIALVFATLVFELLMMLRYRRLTNEAQKGPLIDVNIRSTILEEFKQEVGASLQFQMSEIIEVYRKIREEFEFRNTPVEIGKELSKMMALSSASLNLDPFEHPTDYKVLYEHMKKVKIKIKYIEVPLGTLVKLILLFFQRVPAPYRNQFLRNIIYVSFVSVGDVMQITVSCKGRGGKPKEGTNESPKKLTYSVAKNEEESEIFRNAAFMILELHGKAFPGLKWKGMRYFTDGLALLDRYRREPKQDFFTKAKNAFRRAVEADLEEYEACCFLGSMLMSERKKDSINEAIGYFEQALNTDRPKFKAFVHAGLAHCYAQQYHRLARRKPDVLNEAREHAKLATDIWKGEEAKPHPWLNYMRAIVQVVDEGVDCSPEDMKQQFIPAINMCYGAIQGQPNNGLFHNTLGWMLLKLAEKGVPKLMTADGISKDLTGNVAEKAEQFLLRSIALQKTNKLSHANLCLLYATPHFRNKYKKYLRECRFYGEKAIQIDPHYINGYRDLAVSLIRYGEFDEAYEHYLKALEESPYIEKDLEIMNDAKKILVQMGVEKEKLKRWDKPPPELLSPPSSFPPAKREPS
ncbi:MAG: hypothetical protein KAT34_00370 [Candidatus Aminicenantes bacterium]|nr:hypothetical protein [Candidatus Aminicenantes bacterium]